MKQYETNNALFEVFKKYDVTQMEFGYLTETDRHSIHDWFKHKNQMKFDKLNECLAPIGYKAKIVIEKI